MESLLFALYLYRSDAILAYVNGTRRTTHEEKTMNNSNLGQFCDEKGNTLLGSDSIIYFDGRWNQESRDNHARDIRERYRKNFSHLYKSMGYYIYRGNIRIVDCK